MKNRIRKQPIFQIVKDKSEEIRDLVDAVRPIFSDLLISRASPIRSKDRRWLMLRAGVKLCQ